MPDVRNSAHEEKIHLAFEISLFLKGLFALGQIIGGIVAFFVSREFLLKAVSILTQDELAEDPHDLVANYRRRGRAEERPNAMRQTSTGQEQPATLRISISCSMASCIPLKASNCGLQVACPSKNDQREKG
jgi:hypothetical protein